MKTLFRSMFAIIAVIGLGVEAGAQTYYSTSPTYQNGYTYYAPQVTNTAGMYQQMGYSTPAATLAATVAQEAAPAAPAGTAATACYPSPPPTASCNSCYVSTPPPPDTCYEVPTYVCQPGNTYYVYKPYYQYIHLRTYTVRGDTIYERYFPVCRLCTRANPCPKCKAGQSTPGEDSAAAVGGAAPPATPAPQMPPAAAPPAPGKSTSNDNNKENAIPAPDKAVAASTGEVEAEVKAVTPVVAPAAPQSTEPSAFLSTEELGKKVQSASLTSPQPATSPEMVPDTTGIKWQRVYLKEKNKFGYGHKGKDGNWVIDEDSLYTPTTQVAVETETK